MSVRSLSTLFLGAFILTSQIPSNVSAKDCELALVLALDVSKSMDTTEFNLQFGGTAAALRDPEVQAAILAQGALVAISAFEWSGQAHQAPVSGWTILRTRSDIEAFASLLQAHIRGGRGEHTGTGSALEFAYRELANGPSCSRSIVDISSDGYSNDGLTPKEVYRSGQFDSVTVNALVVGGKERTTLWDYFRRDVIYGPGAFAMATVSFEDYPRAIKEKLLRELRPALLAAVDQP